MNITSEKWCKRFLRLAHEIASWSKDESSRVGCVITGIDGKPKSFGYNGFPRGVDDSISKRHERPEKYLWFEHAERNAIYQCKTDMEGCVVFVTHHPCSGCARAMIQSGISIVIIDNKNGRDSEFGLRNKDEVRVALEMFSEAKVYVTEIKLEK